MTGEQRVLPGTGKWAANTSTPRGHLLPITAVLAAHPPGVVALAAGELAEKATRSASIATLAVIQGAVVFSHASMLSPFILRYNFMLCCGHSKYNPPFDRHIANDRQDHSLRLHPVTPSGQTPCPNTVLSKHVAVHNF
jgi:hypothetical protein